MTRRWILLAMLVCCAQLAAGRIMAAPPTQAKVNSNFTFVVYGDTRGGYAVHRAIVADIVKIHPVLVLQTGDLVADGRSARLWKIYDQIVAPLHANHILVYPARGNHDLGGPGYEEHVTDPFTSGTKLHYSLDYGNCHFVSIDSFEKYGAGSPQYKWLESDLAAADKASQHIFVFFHVSSWSVGLHGDSLPAQKWLDPLFEKYHVRAVFSGHDHIYYRTVRKGVTYVVTGGGGAPLYPVDAGKGEITGDVAESVHNYVVCKVRGNVIVVTAYRLDGSVLDDFTLHAPGTIGY